MEKILELKHIDKHFGVVHALKDVSLTLHKGETLALVGENGAGKSTLMKIINGVYTKNSGEIFVRGVRTNIANPKKANQLGIGQVYQQSELIPEFSVTENIFLGEHGYGKKGFIGWSNLHERAEQLLKLYEIDLDVKKKVKHLSIPYRQLVSIVKVLQRNPDIIIFDEPTAVLSDNEVEILFKLIRIIQKNGVSVIYISHRLEEIFKVADKIAVMRDGQLITVLENRDVSKQDIIVHMIGRKFNNMFPPIERPETRKQLLEVRDFTTNRVHNVTFDLFEGEILGIAGLVGSGRTELAKGLFGADQIQSGEIMIRGKKVSIRSPKDALQHGIFLAPEDRKGEALVQIRSIREGITLANRREISRLGFCNEKKERGITEQLKEDLNIRAPNVETLVQNLSGGNQQKVVVAKAINTNPDILIFDEPTQGIDVGAKYEIYEILERLRASGKSIIFISSEMEELQGMCSRIMVMRQNTVAGFVEDNLEDSEAILQLMYKGVNT